MQSLIFHIGVHRTASSAIQMVLDQHRSDLGACGVALCLPADLRRTPPLAKRRPGVVHGHRRVERAVQTYAASDASSLIVSEENLAGPMPTPRLFRQRQPAYPAFASFARWAASRFDDFDVNISMAVRRQDRWIESLYAFQTLKGLRADFRDFAKWMMRQNLDWNIYPSILAQYGLQNTARFITYECIRKESIATWLPDFFGGGFSLPQGATMPTANSSPVPNMLRVFVALNRIGWARGDQTRRRDVRRIFWSRLSQADDAVLSAIDFAALLEASAIALPKRRRALAYQHYCSIGPPTYSPTDRRAVLAPYDDANTYFLSREQVSGNFSADYTLSTSTNTIAMPITLTAQAPVRSQGIPSR